MAAKEQDTQANVSPRAAVWLDGIERVLVLALYGWLVWRLVAVYLTKGSAVDLILIPSEGLVVLFMLLRRGTRHVSTRPGAWVLAFGATTSPLLARSGVGSPLLPLPVIATVMLMGILVQLHAKLVLGRSFGCVAANRGLKSSGPYRLVRHPMYLGYLVTHVGFLLANPTVWNGVLYAACYGLQIPRLIVEERLLRQDSRYESYMGRVRYRLIPGLF
jgi:protein-S-isoprenylcysteine O-methyltransferase Ste14